ncbi:luciferase [Mycobacterium intracellulare]|uniref:LLM class F420-dependent oxidoreductase n=1 Tax=Mycobacterium paraintracellulare TaxID=1138383 RepID=A0ABN6AXK0_9MYCO|nr:MULTISPECIES: TIGR03621 family F420-dependent LLM class oxidoreductase [Mycobacterium]OBH62053.1 luciferase [Mycobacterium intracellulare]OSC28721.1 LLM class F420-dependent oxidoreductase [Mycobacterium paraintracellulare]WSE53699.1 TIGR03621 family F420-dependent LLM class oxidoreductase [Mycobacterium sp. 2-64]BBY72544.1 LLM class F420-dependent oxidoreductase [Mycobacterium paraintracellulare]BCO89640.1 LLM class F420-dependent oxidoreductase [Mycobacterium paraintracellulare]
MAKSFRFGVALSTLKSRSQWRDAVRRVEDFGYDVLHLPDHLVTPAPFAALLSAAEVTTMRLSPFVLNAGFYKPALLARDVAAIDLLTDHRFELGLGAGYVKEEFEAAELVFPSARGRVDHLSHMTGYLREHVPTVPIMIAGSGDRVLTLAARQANIIGLSGSRANSTAADPLDDLVGFIRDRAGDRFDDIELNLMITALPHDDSGVPKVLRTSGFGQSLSEEQILASPTTLAGSPRTMADTLCRYVEDYGITYISVPQLHAEAFSKVIAQIR